MNWAFFLCKSTCCCRPESAEDNILDILDSPARESKPFLSASCNQRVIPSLCSAFTSPAYSNLIYLIYFHTQHFCRSHFPLVAESFVLFLFLPIFLLSFSPSAFLSDSCRLLYLPGHRAVWNHRKAAGELQSAWSFACVSSDAWAAEVSYHQCSFCPSGQQDRWAAVWIPIASEG